MSTQTIPTPTETTRTLVVERLFPHPPEKLWRALTESPLLAQWMMKNDFEPTVGRRFQFRADPMPNWNGIVDCEVLEVVQESKLVYSWGGGSAKDEGNKMETTVTWTLEPAVNGGTQLKLAHYGFHADDFAFKVMGQGWRTKGEAIDRAAAAS